MTVPFFSVCIPTYNKSEDLKNAINSVLEQTYKDFELIISDNNSPDDTKQIVQSCKDKRIKYFKNSNNIGWIKNLKKAISKANGEYVLLQGDDDYMITSDCLQSLYKILKNKEYGFVRLNYLSNKNGIMFNFKDNKLFSKDMSLISKKNNYEVFEFIQKIDPYFLTGICFKNNPTKKISFINSELAPWFKIIFYNSKNGGAYYSSKYFFIAKWISQKIHPFYFLKNNKFMFELYLNEVSKLIGNKEYDEFERKLFRQIISTFPLAKLNLGGVNLINCSKRILYLCPYYKFSLYFWLFFLISLIVPKVVLLKVKEYYLQKTISKNIVKVR